MNECIDEKMDFDTKCVKLFLSTLKESKLKIKNRSIVQTE
jgi:hypothetical protein